jgi:DNA-binding CsgD family transcriptional regulator
MKRTISPQQAKRMASRRRARMMELLAQGLSKAQIARRYRISRQRVDQILGRA